jgi:FKBP-type peptidyl-prolyl cis-trans isomerase
MKSGRFAFGTESLQSRESAQTSRRLFVASRKARPEVPAFVEPLESRVMLSSTTGAITLMADYNYIYSGENSPSSITWTDFGETSDNGNNPLTRTYTIENNTNNTLTLIGANPITLTYPGAQDYFSVTSQPSDTVAAGGTATFTIQFEPTAAGEQYATVSIASSDPAGPFTFGIKGDSLNTSTVGTAGLLSYTTTPGGGYGAVNNTILDVNYSGYLEDGTLFDSSENAGRTPFQFELGVGSVIQGWDQGLVGIKIGESRTLIIPAALGYGDSGQGLIPAGATLIFDITCLDIINAVGNASNGWVAVNDGASTPSTANATDFGTISSTSNSPITREFDIEAYGGDLNLLLAGNPISVAGSSAFTVGQQLVVNSENTSGYFTITYTPTTNLSTAIVTVKNAQSGLPNFTFSIEAQGPAADDGAAQFSNSTWNVTGDAYNPLSLSTIDSIKVVISGGPTQTIPANEISPELQTEFGTSYHDFTYAVPALSVGAHTIQIYAIDPGTNSTTLLATTSVTSQNNLFDEHYYLMANPTVSTEVADGAYATGYDQYLAYGQYHGMSPSPYWDEAWYLKENPTVASEVKAGTYSSGFMQFYLSGQYNESTTGLLYFDTSYYLQNNPDVATAVSSGEFSSAFEHFVLFGQYEDRSPMKYFSSSVYDADNPQVLGGWTSGETLTSDYEHFILYGQYEGLVASNYYNEHTYLTDNPTVAAEVQSGQYPDGFQQWLEYGQYEGLTAV